MRKPPRPQGEISALYADPDVWGQGVGRSLIDHAIRDLRTLGRTELSLWVLRQNQRGIKSWAAQRTAPRARPPEEEAESIDRITALLPPRSLHETHRLMGVASGTEPVAVMAEMAVKAM